MRMYTFVFTSITVYVYLQEFARIFKFFEEGLVSVPSITRQPVIPPGASRLTGREHAMVSPTYM